MMVVDSGDTVVGNVTGFTFDGSQRVLPAVVLERNGQRVGLLVHPDRFEGSGPSLAYESLDCTGQAWLNGPFATLILPGTIEGPGQTVYIPDLSATPGLVTAQSLLQMGRCFTFQFDVSPAVPALPLVDLDTVFTPPFRLK
jgi:hypothetical protein